MNIGAVDLAWYDGVGLLGSALVVGSYFLLQSGRLSGTGLPYQLLNIAGSACILVSLIGGFNVSVALLQCTWIAISVYGVVRGLRANRRDSNRPDPNRPDPNRPDPNRSDQNRPDKNRGTAP